MIPVAGGKPATRSEKAAVVGSACRWTSPIYETVSLTVDPKGGKINEKCYHIVLSATGSAKSGVLGEIVVNLADFADSFKPSSFSLPLKPPSAGTILHVTVQRMQGDVDARRTNGEGDLTAKNQRRTLRSQLSNSEIDGDGEVEDDENGINPTEVSDLNGPARMKSTSSTPMAVMAESNGNLVSTSSFEAASGSSSDSSSGAYTPKENASTLLSPLSSSQTPRDLDGLGNDWSIVLAPNGSSEASTSSSDEALQGNVNRESDDLVNNLKRQLEVSELELQSLRKQVVKEVRRGQDLARELQSMKEECKELKASKKGLADDGIVSAKLKLGDKDPWSVLEETKQELNHEKNLNANLHLQLQKMQESNSELILAVRDLEEMLELRNRKICSRNGSCTAIEPDITRNMEEIVCKIRLNSLLFGECKQESHGNSAVDVLMNEAGDAKITSSTDHKISYSSAELELYKKEREELEMQMEQLALDYEILKQENHEISTKLEQIQLREQLRMQYECSAHFAAISELETKVECLEKELQRQEEAFEADLAIVTSAKVEQEKRVIQAEEALRKTKLYNSNAAERLQEEFKRLNAQMSSAIYTNEKLVVRLLRESSDLQLQKCHLEEVLEKANEELQSVEHQHHFKSQQLLSLIDFKTKEADSLLLELKEKRKELENQRINEETKQKASQKEISQLKGEIEKLSRENNHPSEQIKLVEQLKVDMEQARASSSRESEVLLQDCKNEKSMLLREPSLLKEEAKKSLEELNDLRQIKTENDSVISNPNSDISTYRKQFNSLKNSIFEDEVEKEKLRKQVIIQKEDLQKEASVVAPIQKKINVYNAKLTNSEALMESSTRSKNSTFTQEQNSSQDPTNCHERAPPVEGIEDSECHLQTPIMEANAPGNHVSWNDTAMIISNSVDNLEKQDQRPDLCSCEQQKTTEVLREIAELKEQKHMMEAELKEMQEKYSEMSLKFAEVEGERQHLVIKIRGLRNAKKI
ncbi:hypothetical protein AXF42_Ash015833 [Apostasia shenzhenica]|uniref:C2 NT-type domain-containing protein n=1 Tax=Apostasia shenzhenica TaxID=1088818 RepID=A0A2H9ZXP0_9ASPA|nr:hypothetical protein AXF42_Ash015833 [Apostasia shenzhenica]